MPMRRVACRGILVNSASIQADASFATGNTAQISAKLPDMMKGVDVHLNAGNKTPGPMTVKTALQLGPVLLTIADTAKEITTNLTPKPAKVTGKTPIGQTAPSKVAATDRGGSSPLMPMQVTTPNESSVNHSVLIKKGQQIDAQMVGNYSKGKLKLVFGKPFL
ncbi:unnamed protein product [Cuscuta europaea]|uniref:Uncharacterized protein n=1 Tax=Cuscuta europaea TaxID=41803 RepID=A0A9P1A0R7_CUSEU|nr:unnamed protein product [Cuscuta europaea]